MSSSPHRTQNIKNYGKKRERERKEGRNPITIIAMASNLLERKKERPKDRKKGRKEKGRKQEKTHQALKTVSWHLACQRIFLWVLRPAAPQKISRGSSEPQVSHYMFYESRPLPTRTSGLSFCQVLVSRLFWGRSPIECLTSVSWIIPTGARQSTYSLSH